MINEPIIFLSTVKALILYFLKRHNQMEPSWINKVKSSNAYFSGGLLCLTFDQRRSANLESNPGPQYKPLAILS